MIDVGGFHATVRMERLWPPVMVERRAEGWGRGVEGASDAVVVVAVVEEAGKQVRE